MEAKCFLFLINRILCVCRGAAEAAGGAGGAQEEAGEGISAFKRYEKK